MDTPPLLSVDQLSPHILTLPFCFTEVTIGAAHSLVAAFLMTPSASSSFSASSTTGLWPNAIGWAFKNGGWQPPQGGSMLEYFSSSPDLQGKHWHVYSKLLPGLEGYLPYWSKPVQLNGCQPFSAEKSGSLILHYVNRKFLTLPLILNRYIAKPHEFHLLTHVGT